jgi:hypothetical protein
VGQQHGRVGTVVHKERSRCFGTHTTSKFLVAFFFVSSSSFICQAGGGVQSQGETKIVPNAHAMRLWAEGEAANLMMKSFPDLLTGNQQQNILVGVPPPPPTNTIFLINPLHTARIELDP